MNIANGENTFLKRKINHCEPKETKKEEGEIIFCARPHRMEFKKEFDILHGLGLFYKKV